MKPKQQAGPPMDLGNMRNLGVQRLIANETRNPPRAWSGPTSVCW